MKDKQKTYIAIDLKSFYASVECVERGLDPLNVNLVVADESRTNKTICLAVSPSLKSFGLPGRPRLYEVEQKVKEINRQRQMKAPGGRLTGKSFYYDELEKNVSLRVAPGKRPDGKKASGGANKRQKCPAGSKERAYLLTSG